MNLLTGRQPSELRSGDTYISPRLAEQCARRVAADPELVRLAERLEKIRAAREQEFEKEMRIVEKLDKDSKGND